MGGGDRLEVGTHRGRIRALQSVARCKGKIAVDILVGHGDVHMFIPSRLHTAGL